MPLYEFNMTKYVHPYPSVFVLYTWNSDERVRNVRRMDTKTYSFKIEERIQVAQRKPVSSLTDRIFTRMKNTQVTFSEL